MVLGLSLGQFTLLHVLVSLAAMGAGAIVLLGMMVPIELGAWTAVFLATAILTSATGFLFPFSGLLPSHIFGILSLVILAVALFAVYARRLAGSWRWIFVTSVATALYLDLFVGIAQAFQKSALLHPLAPTGSEPPFLIAQAVLLAIMLVLGILAASRFRRLALA